MFDVYGEYFICSMCVVSTSYVRCVWWVLHMLDVCGEYFICSMCVVSTSYVRCVWWVLHMFDVWWILHMFDVCGEYVCMMWMHVCRQLLWHGSRLSNWVGILSQGLRIAPPEAPVTGYMVSWPLFIHTHTSMLWQLCHHYWGGERERSGFLHKHFLFFTARLISVFFDLIAWCLVCYLLCCSLVKVSTLLTCVPRVPTTALQLNPRVKGYLHCVM